MRVFYFFFVFASLHLLSQPVATECNESQPLAKHHTSHPVTHTHTHMYTRSHSHLFSSSLFFAVDISEANSNASHTELKGGQRAKSIFAPSPRSIYYGFRGCVCGNTNETRTPPHSQSKLFFATKRGRGEEKKIGIIIMNGKSVRCHPRQCRFALAR